MPMKPKTKRRPRKFLRLTDLDHAKRNVVNTLGSVASARAYRSAIDDFIDWYSSEPRLAFSKHVVLRYRLELECRWRRKSVPVWRAESAGGVVTAWLRRRRTRS